MKLTRLTFILVLFISAGCSAQDFFHLSLNDFNNKKFHLSQWSGKKAIVAVFLLTDCPASQSYTLTLNNMSEKYLKDSIQFVGIFPGKFSSDSELRKFQADYKVNFPLLKDESMSFAKFLHASVAPECFLIQEGNTVYHGRIDDWMFAVGRKRTVITEHNLQDAIDEVIENKPVKIRETKPVGCILEYE
jgi:peroxiredoxin